VFLNILAYKYPVQTALTVINIEILQTNGWVQLEKPIFNFFYQLHFLRISF